MPNDDIGAIGRWLKLKAQETIAACDRQELGQAWLISVKACRIASSSAMEEEFLRTFGEEAARSEREGNHERVTKLYACLCNHVLTCRSEGYVREELMKLGLNPTFLNQPHAFPWQAQFANAI